MATLDCDFEPTAASLKRAFIGIHDPDDNDVEYWAVRQLVRDLEDSRIEYVSLVAGPWNRYGYQRNRTGIDLVLSATGLECFHSKLVGRGYTILAGAENTFRCTGSGVPISLITTDEFPGDGLPKSVRFPDPATEYVLIDGVHTVRLPRLIELKLASGMTGRGRIKDLADVQELIRVVELPAAFAEQLDASVRAKFAELYDDLHGVRVTEYSHP